jgi:hypothetical protein
VGSLDCGGRYFPPKRIFIFERGIANARQHVNQGAGCLTVVRSALHLQRPAAHTPKLFTRPFGHRRLAEQSLPPVQRTLTQGLACQYTHDVDTMRHIMDLKGFLWCIVLAIVLRETVCSGLVPGLFLVVAQLHHQNSNRQ